MLIDWLLNTHFITVMAIFTLLINFLKWQGVYISGLIYCNCAKIIRSVL